MEVFFSDDEEVCCVFNEMVCDMKFNDMCDKIKENLVNEV